MLTEQFAKMVFKICAWEECSSDSQSHYKPHMIGYKFHPFLTPSPELRIA